MTLPTNATRSLRSVNFTDRYLLTHSDSLGHLDQVTSTFAKDATFRARPGTTAGSVGLESYNFPGRYIRHRDYQLWVDPYEDSDLFRSDRSFTAVSAWV